MIKASYTAPEVVELVPYLDYSRLDYWARIGLRVPSVSDSSGRGTVRRYSFWDIVVIRILALMRHSGYGLNMLRVVNLFLDQTVSTIPADPTYSLLIVSGDYVAICEDPFELSKYSTDICDIACVIPLGRIMMELLHEGENKDDESFE